MPSHPVIDLRGERFHFQCCGVHPFPPLGLKTPHHQWELREVPASICIFNMRSVVVVDPLVTVSTENAARFAGLAWFLSNLFIYRIALVDLSIKHLTQVVKEAFSSRLTNSCPPVRNLGLCKSNTQFETTQNINPGTPYGSNVCIW